MNNLYENTYGEITAVRYDESDHISYQDKMRQLYVTDCKSRDGNYPICYDGYQSLEN